MDVCVLTVPRAAEASRPIFYRCLPVDFIERCDRDPRCADPQSEEHLLRDSARQADGGQRRVGIGEESRLPLTRSTPRGSGGTSNRLSAYARQFLERIEKPDVDEIDGLAPAIAIKQKNTTRNPRSTVATATEIYDYLRLLYARCGEVHCIYCDGLVKRDSMDEVAEGDAGAGRGNAAECAVSGATRRCQLQSRQSLRRSRHVRESSQSPKNTPAMAVAEPLSEPEGAADGAARVGIQPALSEWPDLRILDAGVAARYRLHAAGVMCCVDRIVVSAENRARIVDAAEIAYREAGEVIFEEVPRDEGSERTRHRFSGEYRVHKLPSAREGAGAAAVQFQQSLWRVPALPGIRQHGRLRFEPRHSRQGAEPERWRNRSVEPAQVSVVVYGLEEAGGRAAAFRWTCRGAR